MNQLLCVISSDLRRPVIERYREAQGFFGVDGRALQNAAHLPGGNAGASRHAGGAEGIGQHVVVAQYRARGAQGRDRVELHAGMQPDEGCGRVGGHRGFLSGAGGCRHGGDAAVRRETVAGRND